MTAMASERRLVQQVEQEFVRHLFFPSEPCYALDEQRRTILCLDSRDLEACSLQCADDAFTA